MIKQEAFFFLQNKVPLWYFVAEKITLHVPVEFLDKVNVMVHIFFIP